ncbi:hypothetical protein HK098_003115 [Nowakowskiella sp. JEL0407]|nr:hypothetical protein HK098_003115 [Nowakowskiella sp. JEL0407]
MNSLSEVQITKTTSLRSYSRVFNRFSPLTYPIVPLLTSDSDPQPVPTITQQMTTLTTSAPTQSTGSILSSPPQPNIPFIAIAVFCGTVICLSATIILGICCKRKLKQKRINQRTDPRNKKTKLRVDVGNRPTSPDFFRNSTIFVNSNSVAPTINSTTTTPTETRLLPNSDSIISPFALERLPQPVPSHTANSKISPTTEKPHLSLASIRDILETNESQLSPVSPTDPEPVPKIPTNVYSLYGQQKRLVEMITSATATTNPTPPLDRTLYRISEESCHSQFSSLKQPIQEHGHAKKDQHVVEIAEENKPSDKRNPSITLPTRWWSLYSDGEATVKA